MFRPERLRLWSDARYKTRGTFRPFELHPDGKRFALAPAALEADGEARSRHDLQRLGRAALNRGESMSRATFISPSVLSGPTARFKEMLP